MNLKRLAWVLALAAPMIYYLHGEPDRLVRYLETQGYKDVQLEHPAQHHCGGRWSAYSYTAQAPKGGRVHGGACVFFFIYETSERSAG